MEGPYLNPDFGACRERSRRPLAEECLEFAAASKGLLRWMTIAPEIEGSARMVEDLQAATGGAMTFSVGHSLPAPIRSGPSCRRDCAWPRICSTRSPV